MSNNIVIQQLPPSAITRIGEIDRTQHVTLAYRVKDGSLQAEACDWKIPPWATDHTGPHSVAEKIRAWSPLLQNGVLLGALDGERLAGFAILRGSFEHETIDPLTLFLAALPPTLIAVAAFRLL